jgi:predicted ATPase
LAAASVQGHEFDAAVVARVLQQEAAEVEERLEVLERVHALVRLLREYELPDRTPTVRYAFVHGLYQNALYASLQPTRKASLSAAVARALLGHHGEQNPAVATELALLFEAAWEPERAAHHFLQAAENAVRVSAHQEGGALARRGLALLQTLPETPERVRQALRLQLVLIACVQATQGYSCTEAGRACDRARALCERSGGGVDLFPVLLRLALFYQTRAELQTARDLAEQCLRLAQGTQDPALLVGAHGQLGSLSAYLADYPLALEHCEQVRALYTPERHAPHVLLYGHDPLVRGRCFTAWSLWGLGYPDRSREALQSALSLAYELAQPTSLAIALLLGAVLHLFRRDGPKTRELSEALVALADEQGMAAFRAVGSIWRGWALAEQGFRAEGVEQIRQGAAAFQASGAELWRPLILAVLAESLAHQGQVEEGLAALGEALTLVRGGGERYWEAELYRLQGELGLARAAGGPSAQNESEVCFRRALEVARCQGARVLELRTAVSLGRLYQRQGRPAEARPLLAGTYGRFTEGFDTRDLQEAQALLEELA